MKQQNTMLRVILNTIFCAVLFVGCEKEVNDERLRVTPSNIEIGCEGGTVQVDIESTSGWEVIVPSDCTWVKSDRYESEVGHRQWIKLTISKNNTESTRKATITISNRGQSQDITITQSALSFSVTPESIDAGQEKTTKDISINSNISWSAKSSDSWITISKSSGDVGYSTTTITIAKNTTANSRTGHVEIYNKDYNVSKKVAITQKVASLTINPESIDVGAESITKKITIESNIEWSVNSNANWITLSKSSGKAGTTTLYVNIEANTLASSRTSQITVYNQDYNITKKIVVNQAASTISVSTNSIEVGPESSTQNVNITSNIPWTAKTSDSWITLSKSSGTAGTTTLYVNIEANTLASSRTGQITVYNPDYNITKKIVVNQAASTISVSTNSIEVGPESSTQNVNITSNIPWTAKTSDSWITLSKSTGYAGTTILTINIGANTLASSRSGYVEISNSEYNISRRINIQQNGYTPTEYCCIEYTSTSQITINSFTYFGALIESHTWNNGNGVIRFDGPVTSIGEYAFYNCSSLTSITIPERVTSIGESAFNRCSSLKSITIPNSVTSIGKEAFADCVSLTSINIPNSVTYIGHWVFAYCESLTSIIIPESVTSIGDCAFYCCESLTSITIPESVTTIGVSAFNYCTSLTTAVIGKGIESIGNSAFNYCSSLTSVYCKATTPPTLGESAFDGHALGGKIYVPRNSVNAYKSAEGWSDYAWSIVGYDF